MDLDLTSLDLVGNTLGNSVDGGGQMTADLEGQDGSIDDTDVRGPVDDEVGVNNTTHVLGHHGSGANRVEVGASCSELAKIRP